MNKEKVSEDSAKSTKGVFDIMKEMNEMDIETGSSTIGVSIDVRSLDQVKGGCIVKMGAPKELVQEVAMNKKMVMLLIIDREEWNKRSKELKNQKE